MEQGASAGRSGASDEVDKEEIRENGFISEGAEEKVRQVQSVRKTRTAAAAAQTRNKITTSAHLDSGRSQERHEQIIASLCLDRGSEEGLPLSLFLFLVALVSMKISSSCRSCGWRRREGGARDAVSVTKHNTTLSYRQ